MDNRIPDYSLKAISEALEAAILRAAFLELEEEEMKQYDKEIKEEGELQPDRTAFARKLRARAVQRRLRSALSYGLPRAMQVASCVIGILALGAGVALAASTTAREWAAGVLVANVEDYHSDNWLAEVSPAFCFDEETVGGYESATTLGDTLWLLGNSNNENVLYAQTSTESEPQIYRLKEAQNRYLYRLTAGNGELYGLYLKDADTDKPQFGVGRICLEEESYALETVIEFDYEQFSPPEGCEQRSLYTIGLLWGNGRFYLALQWEDAQEWTHWGCGWGDGSVRMFSVEDSGGAMMPVELPELEWNSANCVLELFAGPDGIPCIAMTTPSKEAVGLWSIQEDGNLLPLGEVLNDENGNASCFACSAGGILYFLQNGGIYATSDFDGTSAQRVAATADSGDCGVALGEYGYAIVNLQKAQIFSLKNPAEVGELRVTGSSNPSARELFVQEHPDIAIVRGSDWSKHEEDNQEILVSDELESDVYILDDREIQYFLNAGVYVPLEDETLLEAVSRMNKGVRDFVTHDGQVVAFPISGYAYNDLSFNLEAMKVLGLAPDDLPETWEELLNMLTSLSHSDRVQACPVSDLPEGAVDFASQLMYNMAMSYADICAVKGQEVDFSDSEFTKLVECFDRIDFAAFRYGEAKKIDGVTQVPGEEPLLRMDGDVILGMDWLETQVSLKFSHDDPLYSVASGKFAVVNPASKQKDLAQQYLLCHLKAAGDASELVNLYAQADLEKLKSPISQEEYELYLEKVGELYFPQPEGRMYMKLEEMLKQHCSAWLAGEAQLKKVIQVLNDFYAEPVFYTTPV